MGVATPIDADRAARKAEKKAKKAKLAEPSKNGVHKSKSADKPTKEKKDKKDRKAQAIAADAENVESTTKILNAIEEERPGSIVVKKSQDEDLQVTVKTTPLLGALVPIAHPLAEEKVGKKVLKGVKKSSKAKTLKRGVKEVVKALRKSQISNPGSELPHGVVVLAADISPLDVISHIPVLCEDHGVPYIFVTSRAELGAASSTKRPTSVVLISREGAKKKIEKDGEEGKDGKDGKDEDDWGEIYADLVKAVVKAGRAVTI